MLWSDWVVVVWLSIGALTTVAAVGQTRKPIDPGTANFSVIATAAIIIMLIATH